MTASVCRSVCLTNSPLHRFAYDPVVDSGVRTQSLLALLPYAQAFTTRKVEPRGNLGRGQCMYGTPQQAGFGAGSDGSVKRARKGRPQKIGAPPQCTRNMLRLLRGRQSHPEEDLRPAPLDVRRLIVYCFGDGLTWIGVESWKKVSQQCWKCVS